MPKRKRGAVAVEVAPSVQVSQTAPIQLPATTTTTKSIPPLSARAARLQRERKLAELGKDEPTLVINYASVQTVPTPAVQSVPDQDEEAAIVLTDSESDNPSHDVTQQKKIKPESTKPSRYFQAASSTSVTPKEPRGLTLPTPRLATTTSDPVAVTSLPLQEEPKGTPCVSVHVPIAGRNIAHVVLPDGNRAICVGLEPNESIVALGTYELAVLRGQASINGALVKPSDKLNVFAPMTHPLPPISPVPSTEAEHSSSQLLPHILVHGQVTPPLSQDAFKQACLVLLCPLATGISSIANSAKQARIVSSSTPMFKRRAPSEWSCYATPSLKNTTMTSTTLDPTSMGDSYKDEGFEILYEPGALKDATVLNVPPSWESYLHKLASLEPSERLCIMPEGSKRAGKSTFAKMCLNVLLRRYAKVAWLDLDPGQTEFAPPGQVALHVIPSPVVGPAFTHALAPYRAHFLGTTTPADEPDTYIEAAWDLIDTYATTVSLMTTEHDRDTTRIIDHVPLIVNTNGWTKGKGGQLLQQLQAHIRPTHRVLLSSQAGIPPSWDSSTPVDSDRLLKDVIDGQEGVPEASYACEKTELEAINDALANTSKLTPADSRQLNLIAHLYYSNDSQTWNFAPLYRRRPFQVTWTSSTLQQVYVNPCVTYQHVLFALNGSLVALIQPDAQDEETANVNARDTFPYHPDEEHRLPSPKTTRCVGYGIVRSIDVKHHQLYILSNLTLSSFQNVCILALSSKIDIPTVVMYDPNMSEEERARVPYLDTESGIAQAKRVRRNVQRRAHT